MQLDTLRRIQHREKYTESTISGGRVENGVVITIPRVSARVTPYDVGDGSRMWDSLSASPRSGEVKADSAVVLLAHAY